MEKIVSKKIKEILLSLLSLLNSDNTSSYLFLDILYVLTWVLVGLDVVLYNSQLILPNLLWTDGGEPENTSA